MKVKHAFIAHFIVLLFLTITSISNAQTISGFKLVSPGFEEGKPIPAKYTCDSTNVSPQLSLSGSPEKAKTFAIIMDDPDAPMGTWVHWVVYNIPGTINRLDEKANTSKLGAVDGLNSWEEKGYNGPCPPGGTHRYFFKLYALDIVLPVKAEMNQTDLLQAMKGHILAEAALVGLFRK